MRPLPVIATSLLLAGPLPAQQDQEPSATRQLKDSVREWIETMREIQTVEDEWERDRMLLEDQRAALRSEIETLEEQIEAAEAEKAGASKEATDESEKRDALAASKEVLTERVRDLESMMIERIPAFPGSMREQPGVKELIKQVEETADLSGDEAKENVTKRLNTVLNLLTEAEKWQQTVHVRDELHTAGDGGEYNMKVIYFGLAVAYAVNESGDFAMVGRPGGEDGWTFTERNELAPKIQEMRAVLNGEADARFISLPIDLK